MDDKKKRALFGLAALIVLRRQWQQRGLKTRNGRSWVKPHIREHDTLLIAAKVTVADRVIKATRCDWLLATTNVDFARTLHNFCLTDSIFESVRRLLCSVRANSTFVVASSQSQRVAFMTRSATVTFAINNYGGLVN